MSREIDGQLSIFDSIDDMIADMKSEHKKQQEKMKKLEEIDKTVEPVAVDEFVQAKADMERAAQEKEKAEAEKARIEQEKAKREKEIRASVSEGIVVKNIYNGETYTALKDKGNYLLVRSKDNTVHEMLKSDIEIVEEKAE